jgi:CRISPR-associated protein Cmr4
VDVTELLLYLYAESPVHAGGSDSIDALDLPVQREATTGYPVIWGQSLKGALRQEAGPDAVTEALFGSGPGEGDDRGATTAGLLTVGDAQLVAMPVPTLLRTFAWVTSPLALHRLRRRYRRLPGRAAPTVPEVATDRGGAVGAHWLQGDRPRHVFGPCLVGVGTAEGLGGWAELLAADAVGEPEHLPAKLREDLLLMGDDIMPTLLAECTEFVARVQLTDDKTVQQGPFYSEYLPAETILAASLTVRGDPASPAHRAQLARLGGLLHGRLLQVGGDETIGKGLVWTRLVGWEAA